MGLRVRATTSNVAITVFVISASIVVAMICSVMMSHNAGALKLGLDVELKLPRVITNPINRILGDEGGSTSPSNPSPGEGSTTPSNPPAVSPDQLFDGNSSSGEFGQAGALHTDTTPLTELAPLRVNLGEKQINPSRIIVSKPDKEVLGQSTIASPASVIRPTSNGWEILGVPWYVWLIGMGAFAFGLKYRQETPAFAPVNKPKS